MAVENVIRFKPEPAGEPAHPSTILAGAPELTVRNVYTDPSGAFSAGIWESTPGKWPVSYTEEEFCLLLAGVVELTDARGRSERFKVGDAFVIRAGFTGTWETVEPVKKLYAIYEKPNK